MVEKYSITLNKDGSQFESYNDETILQAAIRQGIKLPYACTEGYCFGCLQEIVTGETEYRQPLQDVGDLLKYQAMLCKAHAQSDVVLNCGQMPDLIMATDVAEPIPATMLKVFDKVSGIERQQLPRFPVRVDAIHSLADEIIQLNLKLPDWVTFKFIPGQYLDVILDNGERRSFSIGNGVNQSDEIILYIKRVENGFFTNYIFEHLTVGTIWEIEAPLGNFILDDDSSRPILMLATSTGIAPLYSMLTSLNWSTFSRKTVLYWGARYAERLFLNDELAQLAKQHDLFDFVPVLSRANDDWQGARGYVQEAAVSSIDNLKDYDIYISGNPEMVDAALKACQNAGANSARIYLDYFSFQTDNA